MQWWEKSPFHLSEYTSGTSYPNRLILTLKTHYNALYKKVFYALSYICVC